MNVSPDFEQILVTATRFLVDDSSPDGLSGRKSLVENRHLGWLVVTNQDNSLLYCTPGALETATFFRSSAKPFQAFPLVEKGFSKQLSTEELAIACASHTGSQRHLELTRSILAKAGLSEAQLQCGPHVPSDPAMQETLRQSGEHPTRAHNNCSGKHAGMLFYCQQAGLDPSLYLNPSHPLQQSILNALRRWGGVDEIPLAIDGCGAPVFYLPLRTMALLYAHLGSTEDFKPLQTAMTSYPAIVGGEGRVDTVLMQVSQGKLLAKVGADGVLCVARGNRGEGLALKLSDGSGEVRDMTLVQILLKLGWLEQEALQDARLSNYLTKTARLNTQNKTVGEYHVHFNPERN